MNPSRRDILQLFEKGKSLMTNENYDEAYSVLTEGRQSVFKTNFLPLLDPFLEQRILCSTKLNKQDDICTDYLIRLSSEVRTPNPKQIFDSLSNFLDDIASIKFDFVEYLQPLFPLTFSINYEKELIVTGSDVNIQTAILSKSSVPIYIDSISYVLSHDGDDAKEEVIQISDYQEIRPRQPIKIKTQRSLPSAISSETIKYVILKIKSAEIRLSLPNPPKLLISPDESTCKIDIKIPSKFIVGAHVPLQITLTASEQKLERLKISFTEQPSDSLQIHGIVNNHEIENQQAELPDIQPNQSMTLDLTVYSGIPALYDVKFAVKFGTESSGSGEFVREMQFNFITPFTTDVKMLDDNFIELPSNTLPVLEPSVDLTTEIVLMNHIDSPITLKQISNDPDQISIEYFELPVTLEPYETFSFLGNIQKPGAHKIGITYETEGINSDPYLVELPEVLEHQRHVTFTFTSPHVVPLHSEFSTTIGIERIDEVGGPEVIPTKIEIENSSSFFTEGTASNHVEYLFRGQKKEINLKFYTLKAGSTTLPKITLTDLTVDTPKPKIFITPIVITYQ